MTLRIGAQGKLLHNDGFEKSSKERGQRKGRYLTYMRQAAGGGLAT